MVRLGVIGYGYWGPNLVRNFSEAPGAQVTMVSDMRPDRLMLALRRYPSLKTTSDYRELLRDPDIDAVVIATPVSTHYDLAMKALQAGKHVLVEKPMTATTEQALRLVEEAAVRGLRLMVDHTFTYTSAVRKIKELVAAGSIGEIYYYDSVRVNLGIFQHDVNVLWDLAVHDLSIMDYILPFTPYAVSATGMSHLPGKPENIAYLTLFFEESLIAHIHVNWLAPVKIRRTLIGGNRKMIVYDDLEPSEKVKTYDKGVTFDAGAEVKHQMLVGYRAGDMWAPHLDVTEALLTEATHFVRCVEGAETPQTSGESGLRVVRILEAATRSIGDRGRPVELNLSEKDKKRRAVA
ncbi:MAG: oxidoreductase domain protein [Bryobacterales bacterium]|nr:oxidoreductase domain protein [Bryobacterales bacterium]